MYLVCRLLLEKKKRGRGRGPRAARGQRWPPARPGDAERRWTREAAWLRGRAVVLTDGCQPRAPGHPAGPLAPPPPPRQGSSRSFFFNAPPTTEIYTLSLHDALPICFPSTNHW